MDGESRASSEVEGDGNVAEASPISSQGEAIIDKEIVNIAYRIRRIKNRRPEITELQETIKDKGEMATKAKKKEEPSRHREENNRKKEAGVATRSSLQAHAEDIACDAQKE